MAIDFSNMPNNVDDDRDDNNLSTHPRHIFSRLNRSRSFGYCRDIQTEVMNRWYDRRSKKDTVIKLSVGSGKTLVGLLLLQSSLDEKVGPALYVAPNVQLAQQVIDEANSLGIATTDNPNDSDYIAGEKICVVNVYKLFNGKSVFGVGSSRLEIGTVIFDDAHACVSTMSDQFRLVLKDEAYKSVFSVLAADLEIHSEWAYQDITSGSFYEHIEVPFWVWETRQSEILKVLSNHKAETDIMFRYPLLKGILPFCRCVVGSDRIEIEPYFPVTDLFPSFRRAKRRIYMTAMLADDSVIVTHFGANQDDLDMAIVPDSIQSTGERMIIMPEEINTDLTIRDIRQLLSKLSNLYNVVTIVPSNRVAEGWKGTDATVLREDNIIGGIEDLRNGKNSFAILVNRYDGIDLPDDACRILVILDLPEVAPFVDLIDNDILASSTMNLQRQVERIEQGMGRGIRSESDYCVVIILGPRLTSRVRLSEARRMLTPITRQQVVLSRNVFRSLHSPTISELEELIVQGAKPDPHWIQYCKKSRASKTAQAALKADATMRFDPVKLAVRAAFDLARNNQRNDAISTLDDAITNSSEDCVKAWLLYWKARIQHVVDPSAAQVTLKKAHSLEPSVLKPIEGISFRQLSKASVNQTTLLIKNHEQYLDKLLEMKIYVDTLCADLEFRSNSSKQFEAAIDRLASFLGISGHRPELLFEEGPDNLWALDDGSFLVIECKNAVGTDKQIYKKDVAQLGQSGEWFKSKYPSSKHVPILIHPNRELGKGASAIEYMRVIDRDCLGKIRRNLQNFTRQLSNVGGATSASVVARCLNDCNLSSVTFLNTFTKSVKKSVKKTSK